MSAQIKQDTYVSITYTITDESGDVLEGSEVPISFIYGRDEQIIEKIESSLAGRQVGDELNVLLNPSEGFGEYLPELTFTDELENVPEQFRHIGAEVEFQNDHGEQRTFRVTHVGDDTVTVDGNHPFAGKTVTYNISVLEVRVATEAELVGGTDESSRLH